MLEMLFAVVFNPELDATNPRHEVFNPKNVDGILHSSFYYAMLITESSRVLITLIYRLAALYAF